MNILFRYLARHKTGFASRVQQHVDAILEHVQFMPPSPYRVTGLMRLQEAIVLIERRHELTLSEQSAERLTELTRTAQRQPLASLDQQDKARRQIRHHFTQLCKAVKDNTFRFTNSVMHERLLLAEDALAHPRGYSRSNNLQGEHLLRDLS